MIKINWDPISHLGPIPINWYGLFVALGFIVGWLLVWRWATNSHVAKEKVDALLIWIIVGSIIGARLYYIVQNQPGDYLRQPLRIFAVWEGASHSLAVSLAQSSPPSFAPGVRSFPFRESAIYLLRQYPWARRLAASPADWRAWIMEHLQNFPGE